MHDLALRHIILIWLKLAGRQGWGVASHFTCIVPKQDVSAGGQQQAGGIVVLFQGGVAQHSYRVRCAVGIPDGKPSQRTQQQ